MKIEHERKPPTHFETMMAVKAHSAPDRSESALDEAAKAEQRRTALLLTIEFVD